MTKKGQQHLGNINTNDGTDLREHMVGILFSSSNKLSHLQKQVSHYSNIKGFWHLY